ncbi:subtilisin-like protease 2 [Myriangium duriaei CBS 260.36]|uniref:Subtilisin-like protease 2 n=1 Tax=Myriangium duriaei CBS 260.36 TaxID=1168546 RepID=A0A9P4IU34_9PEZI|nr:subtilisin-like protease 2 [Myriangium duriaei CBS 260.36]
MFALPETAAVLAALLPLIAVINAAPSPQSAGSNNEIPNQFIITLKPGTNMAQHLNYVRGIHAVSFARHRKRDSENFAGITNRYNVSDFQAYAGHFDPVVMKQIRASKDVEDIEPDKIYTTMSRVVQYNPPIGLNLISHRGLSQEHKGYAYDSSSGKKTYAYVVDTGIDIHHTEFEGRAIHGHNAVKSSQNDEDNVGHGTHVAGTIGGKTYGIAKSTNLISIKVFDAIQGSLSEVMAGVDFAIKDIIHFKRQKKAVVNMSLGGPYSLSFNKMVDRGFKYDVLMVIAAGNADRDASEVSPSSAAGAITVGATDMYRVRAKFSNYGTNLTLFAPGVDVLSAWPSPPAPPGHLPVPSNATRSLSGTSMAAPHIAGMAAYLMGIKRFGSAKTLRESMVRLSTKKVVGDIKGSPNAFAYNNGGSQVGIWG